MNARPYGRADYLALKSAFRRACEDIGTHRTVAEYTRVDKTRIGNYCNPDSPEFPPIDVMLDVDALSGGDRCLRALAELRQFDLVRDERGVRVEKIERHIGAVGIDSGELISEMCNAIADGVTTPREAEAIERRAEDLKDNITLLQADCRRIRSA